MDIWNYQELLVITLIFIWTGFVRTGLGFGGAALGLPLLLLVGESPVYWLPIIGMHLLFFTSITFIHTTHKGVSHTIDKQFLKASLLWIIPPTLLGVFGLISFSKNALIIFVYSIAIVYGAMWMLDKKIATSGGIIDKVLLVIGGYVAGISLTGAPLIVAVAMQRVSKIRLRDTLFVLWFILVGIKMLTFIIFDISIEWLFSLLLIPIAFIGHSIGLKVHHHIIQNDTLFKKIIGSALVSVSVLGLLKL
jgi:uncharacterized membrane protein YfcA